MPLKDELQAAVSARASKAEKDCYSYSDDFNEDEDGRILTYSFSFPVEHKAAEMVGWQSIKMFINMMLVLLIFYFSPQIFWIYGLFNFYFIIRCSPRFQGTSHMLAVCSRCIINTQCYPNISLTSIKLWLKKAFLHLLLSLL